MAVELPSNERELLVQVALGDRRCFTELLHRYWNKVYTQAITYLRSAELAQEITQDVFLKTWESRHQLENLENFSLWLFVVTKNRVFTELRKKKPTVVSLGEEKEETSLLPDYPLLYKEASALISKAIQELPPVRKKAFTLSRIEGRSYEEIAGELGISRNGVKDHIVKALHFLRNYLKAHSGDLVFLIQLFL